MNASTIFSEDPVSVAKHWIEEGGRRLHVVDLDGAFAGRPKNERLISEIVEAAGEVPVQVGGGIRTRAIAEAYLAAGVSSLIIGTKAVADTPFFEALVKDYPGRIILGLDARGEQIATEGWVTDVGISIAQYLSKVKDWPIQAIVYTDITRDGMMKGYDLELMSLISNKLDIPIIACGGAGNFGHLVDLYKNTDVAAAACSSIFHFGDNCPMQARTYMRNHGIEMRNIK